MRERSPQGHNPAMTGVLRVYDPAECFPDGKPLDWERCSACDGCGHVHVVGGGDFTPAGYHGPEVCARCDGHGSLKAAAQFTKALRVPQAGHGPCGGTGLLREVWPQADGSGAIGDQCHCVALELRCEDCGHPMSEGTWDEPRDGDGVNTERALSYAVEHLRNGDEPWTGDGVHYSPCDEGCRHDGQELDNAPGRPYPYVWRASWRPVDVRTLGWPHDLRPDKLAVLCLRCWAERTR